MWNESSKRQGTTSRESWESLVKNLVANQAELCTDGLDTDKNYLDGSTYVVEFELFGGRRFGFRVEPAASPDHRRDQVLRAIDDFMNVCTAPAKVGPT